MFILALGNGYIGFSSYLIHPYSVSWDLEFVVLGKQHQPIKEDVCMLLPAGLALLSLLPWLRGARGPVLMHYLQDSAFQGAHSGVRVFLRERHGCPWLGSEGRAAAGQAE